MQILLELLLRLTDFFCWLCSKREKLATRLRVERGLFDDRRIEGEGKKCSGK